MPENQCFQAFSLVEVKWLATLESLNLYTFSIGNKKL